MSESIFDVVVCVLYDNSVAFVCLFDYNFFVFFELLDGFDFFFGEVGRVGVFEEG